MRHETLWFRLTVVGLAIAGLVVLGLSLHGRHRPPADDVRLPTVVGPAPSIPAR